MTSQRRTSDEWRTPPELFSLITGTFGLFDLDAAATAGNTLCPMFYTAEDDGLSQSWKHRTWCNPPYSETGKWTAKAASEIRAGHTELAVLLVPACGTQWWQRALSDGAHVIYWPNRLIFLPGPHRAAFDSALLIYGNAPRPVAHRCQICNNVFLARRDARTCSPRCRMTLSRAHEEIYKPLRRQRERAEFRTQLAPFRWGAYPVTWSGAV